MPEAERNLAWATALVAGLAAAGVHRVVLSPGSRSTPLALACLRHPGLDVRVLIDERSAAFFALGMAKAEGRPALLVCTSGSAPANWFPAVVEADMAKVPLVLLTADRPPELQDCGANQTLDQTAMFGAHVRAFHALPPAGDDTRWLAHLAARVVAQSCWPLPGPVHLNLPLREPLVSLAAAPRAPLPPGPEVLTGTGSVSAELVARLATRLAGRGMIVCGAEELDEAGAAALGRLAEAAGCPILADPLSGLRRGPYSRRVVARYDAFLRDAATAAALRPDWVLRFGAMPVSKTLNGFLAGCGAVQVLAAPQPRWADADRLADIVVHADAAALAEGLAARLPAPPASWFAAFTAAEDAARAALAEAPAEARVVAALADALPDGALLFAGNSLAVREIDFFLGTAARRLRLLGNRGLSGIDGNLSTFLGAAAALGGRAAALVGDLTFLHDLGGLAAAGGLDVLIVVLNNGGGGIFAHLPQAGLPEFERGWLAPQDCDLAHAARLFRLAHRRVEAGAAGLAEAMAEPGPAIVEVAIDARESVVNHGRYWDSVRNRKPVACQ